MKEQPGTGAPGDSLIEEALGAWRPRTPAGRILPSPAWADLDDGQRRRLFEESLRLRLLERALDPEGLSTTAHAVLERIGRRKGG
jgi:hypothetical protein